MKYGPARRLISMPGSRRMISLWKLCRTNMFFEGAGDALFCGKTLFSGYRIRSDVQGHHYLAKALQRQNLPLELVDPRFYHLDTCFCPLAPSRHYIFLGLSIPMVAKCSKRKLPS